MNQIPNIEETDNSREIEEIVNSLELCECEHVTSGEMQTDRIKREFHHQLQKAREEVYKEVQANAEQCYRDNRRGAFEPVRAVPLYKLFTS